MWWGQRLSVALLPSQRSSLAFLITAFSFHEQDPFLSSVTQEVY